MHYDTVHMQESLDVKAQNNVTEITPQNASQIPTKFSKHELSVRNVINSTYIVGEAGDIRPNVKKKYRQCFQQKIFEIIHHIKSGRLSCLNYICRSFV